MNPRHRDTTTSQKMTSFKCEYEYPAGTLSIDVTMKDVSDTKSDSSSCNHTMIHLTFDAIATGARYEKTYSQMELSEMCAILGESVELEATLNIWPKCKIDTLSDPGLSTVRATFTVAGRKKQYPIDLVLGLRVYTPDQQEIAKLMMKNIKLQKTIDDLSSNLAHRHPVQITDVYDKFIKIMPAKCDRESNDFTEVALDLTNSEYDHFIQFKLINPNHGIGPFLCRLFKFGDLFYPYNFCWDFSELAIQRLEIMVAHGLDVTQKIHDPTGSWNAAPSISCIDFVKRTLVNRQDEFDKYLKNPAHKPKIDIYPVSLTGILERMRHGYQILADSVRT